jgi:hypothetical protein
VRTLAAVTIGMAFFGLAGAEAAPSRPTRTCAAFMQDYPKALPGFRVSFERPLTITRDLFGGDEEGIDVHVLADNAEIDGALRCKGDAFRRFEVRTAASGDATALATFSQFQQAALSTFFGWDTAKAQTIISAMSSDADEYLRASIQRGDTYRAGKVEYHQGAQYDLGLIWTESDHTFIITTQDNP